MTKNNLPSVSIIMPTYNGERYIAEAIDSCLKQTFNNIELIILDDGSTDNTSNVVKEINDSRIRLISLNHNSGLALALNQGFMCSIGDYLTWTSDDNTYEPEAIDIMVDYLEKDREVDFIYSNYYLIDEEDKEIKPIYVDFPYNLLEGNCIGPCFMYRRKVYEQIGDYNPKFFLAEDYDYWIRIFKSGLKMMSIDKFLYKYRLHQYSKTAKYGADVSFKQAMKIRSKYFKGYCFKKFFISRSDVLRGIFIWRREWLKEKCPIIVKSLTSMKNELKRIK